MKLISIEVTMKAISQVSESLTECARNVENSRTFEAATAVGTIRYYVVLEDADEQTTR